MNIYDECKIERYVEVRPGVTRGITWLRLTGIAERLQLGMVGKPGRRSRNPKVFFIVVIYS
jgi:hypothetical protein